MSTNPSLENMSEMHRRRAAEFSERGDWENAIREYRAVLELVPHDDETRLDLCTALLESKQLSQAEDELKKLTDLKLDESLWWDDIGDVYLAQGQIVDAERAFQEALELNPDRHDTRAKLRALDPAALENVPPTMGRAYLRKVLPFALVVAAISIVVGCAMFAVWLAPMLTQNASGLMQQRIVLRANRSLTGDELTRSADIFRQRLKTMFGTSYDIRTQAPDTITVRAPAAIEIVPALQENFSESASLEFIETGQLPLEEGVMVETSGPDTVVAPGTPIPDYVSKNAAGQKVYRTVLTGQDLQQVGVRFDQNTNSPMISFNLTGRGQEIFAEYTTNHVGEYLAIVLNHKVISSPIINSPITGGEGVIQGRFTLAEAQHLAAQLNAQPLPAEFRVESTSHLPIFFP